MKTSYQVNLLNLAGTCDLFFPVKALASAELSLADFEDPVFLISLTILSMNQVLYLIGIFLHST